MEYKSGGTYTVERVGQQDPGEGDGMVVRATLRLPVDQNDWRLARELRFGERLQLADCFMTSTWGTGNGATREVARKFIGATWAEATAAARSWAENELSKLDAAIAARELALAAAEPHPVDALLGEGALEMITALCAIADGTAIAHADGTAIAHALRARVAALRV